MFCFHILPSSYYNRKCFSILWMFCGLSLTNHTQNILTLDLLFVFDLLIIFRFTSRKKPMRMFYVQNIDIKFRPMNNRYIIKTLFIFSGMCFEKPPYNKSYDDKEVVSMSNKLTQFLYHF